MGSDLIKILEEFNTTLWKTMELQQETLSLLKEMNDKK